MKKAANISSPIVNLHGKVQIAPIYEYRHMLPVLAEIWHDALGEHYGPEYPKEKMQEMLQDHLCADAIPTGMVALLDGEIVGLCVIRASEDFGKPYIVPSLGAMSVRQEYRNHGIGGMLVRAAIQKTAELGFARLYLFTVDMTINHWYEKFGFKSLGIKEWENGHLSTMMELVIRQQQAA